MGLVRLIAEKPSPKRNLLRRCRGCANAHSAAAPAGYCTVTAITVLWTTPAAEVPVTSTV